MTLLSFDTIIYQFRNEYNNSIELENETAFGIRLLNSILLSTVSLNQNVVAISKLSENSVLVSIDNHPSFEVRVSLEVIATQITRLGNGFNIKLANKNFNCDVDSNGNRVIIFIRRHNETCNN